VKKDDETLSFSSNQIHIILRTGLGGLRSFLTEVFSDLRLEYMFVVLRKDQLFEPSAFVNLLRCFEILDIDMHWWVLALI
jgi:hypothetical protein